MLNDLWTRVMALSGALVTPDWGALVALIPLLLLLVVVAFLAITGVKWASVGPSSVGGRRQRPPLTPDGRTMRSPAVAPLLLAAGVFLLAVGLVAGVAWLLAGAAIAAVALIAWAAQLRDSRPGPSLPRLSRTRLGVLVAVVAVAAVLVATAKVVPDTPGTAGGASGPGSGQAATSLAPADATLTARGVLFVEPTLAVPAGRPFTVAFDNRDSVPHNLEIRDANGSVVFRGDFVTGPAIKVYDIPTLPAGAYPFICTIHPAMTGTLTVK